MSGSPPINLVTQLNLHWFQLRMMLIWLLLKVRLLLSDQSAGFDTIDHDTLPDSLSSWFGVSGVVLNWFKSYLSDHVQCIKIGSILSDAKKLLYREPQGCVLGPILFSLYTTLCKVIQNHPGISFQFYTDDTQLYVHLAHKNVTSALDNLSHCLEDVKRLLSTNKLKLNPDKSKFIVFGSKSQCKKLNHSFPVNILCNLISPVYAVRNLGVWFDSDFSFSCHVMKVFEVNLIACFLRSPTLFQFSSLKSILDSVLRMTCLSFGTTLLTRCTLQIHFPLSGQS